MKRILRALVFLVSAALLIIKLFSGGDDGDKETFNETDGVFAVTVDLNGGEREEDKKLLFASLGGCGVKAAFFCECDYIEAHKSELSEAVKNGHSVHMLINLPENVGKYELMLYIASENDRFFELTGKYPSYVRSTSKPTADALYIFDKYGQIICNSTVKCTAVGCPAGDIIELAEVDHKTVCALMSVITERISNGSSCVPLSLCMS